MTYDVSHVERLMRQAKAEGHRPRILFWWGAGCSVTAGVDTCDKQAPRIARHVGRQDLTDYMSLMDLVDSDYRPRLVRDLVSGAHLNWAHIALAQLIKEGHIDRVITTNFDSLIEDACHLLGFNGLSVYDLPATLESVFSVDRIQEPALIYMHGRHNGLIQLTTAEQTQNNPLAKKAIASVADYAWLVIGYSGENDLLFPMIKEQFPLSPKSERYWGIHGETKPHLSTVLRPNVGGACPIPISGADEFMVELARQVGLFPPKLFLDPTTHFRSRLTEFKAPAPTGVDHLLSFSRDTLATYDRLTYGEVRELFVKAFNIYCQNSMDDMLLLANHPANAALVGRNAGLAALVADGCLRAGDFWVEAFLSDPEQDRPEDEDPTQQGNAQASKRNSRDQAIRNYNRAAELWPAYEPSVALKISQLPEVVGPLL